jgi:hypothetical protein
MDKPRLYLYPNWQESEKKETSKVYTNNKRGRKKKFYRLSSNVNKKKKKRGPKLNRWSERHPYTAEMHFANTHRKLCSTHASREEMEKYRSRVDRSLSLQKVENNREKVKQNYYSFFSNKRYTQEGMTFDGRKIHHRNANSTPRPQKEEEVPCVPASVATRPNNVVNQRRSARD